jgi:4'-phosphopantetheinyl transferase
MRLDWPLATESAALAAGDVHVWAVPLAETASDAAEQRVLSDDERKRADRFAVEPPRRRFVKSRAALRTILGRYLAVAAEDVALQYDGSGKPSLAGEFRASGLQFNLAHSGELALVAVTVDCPVGVDVEFRRPVRGRDEIARRYFAAAELAAVLAHDESQRTAAFFRCWTRKEAVLKAIGTGLGYPLSAFEVPIDGAASSWIELPAHRSRPVVARSPDRATAAGSGDPRTTAAAARCWWSPLDPCAGYEAAIATLGAERRPVCFTFGR